MISSNDLQKCINLLAQISNYATYDNRQKALEIGYILKKELDIVTGVEKMSQESNRGRNLDMQGLINDNVQLFHENQKLLNENMELKTMLESRVNDIALKIHTVSSSISQVNQMISNLR